MNIPPDVNIRAEAMWRIISHKIDFRKKSVIDLGCGHGEMLWRAYVAGAKEVYGIDKDINNAFKLGLDVNDIWYTQNDINILVKDTIFPNYDIAICFSVLPYLDDVPAALQWMADNFELCLFEVQYTAEPYNIGVKNDEEMFSYLRNNGFDIVVNMGKTYVEIRDTFRTLWACSASKVRF